MQEVSLLAALTKSMTIGGAGVWVLVALFALTLVKTWPALRKLQNESDASLRADLMKLLAERDARILALERQMMDERRQCREEIDELRAELAGLHRQIIQNSRTTAQMIGDPGAAPTVVARLREDRK